MVGRGLEKSWEGGEKEEEKKKKGGRGEEKGGGEGVINGRLLLIHEIKE